MHLYPGTVPKTYLEVKDPGAAATSMTLKTKCGKQRKGVEVVKLKNKKSGTAPVIEFFYSPALLMSQTALVLLFPVTCIKPPHIYGPIKTKDMSYMQFNSYNGYITECNRLIQKKFKI